MQALVLFVGLISAALAQQDVEPPKPCVSPPQWESRYFEHNEQLKFFLMGHLSYDAVNKRERIIDEVYLDHQREYYDMIYLHQEQKQYRLNLRTRKCTVEALNRPWRDIGVPEGAKSLGDIYIGSADVPNGNLLTSNWFGELKHDSCSTRYMLQFTNAGCLPVSAVYLSEKMGSTVLRFYDIHPGIKNPDVFTPHKECSQEENKEIFV